MTASPHDPPLVFTGHPLADVAVAAVAAFAGRDRPEEVTLDDLDRLADYIERNYFQPGMASYLNVVFTYNAAYTQKSLLDETRRRFIKEVLHAHRSGRAPAAQGLRCIFTRRPADRIAYRHHVPMLTGEGVLNFYPSGTDGLPVSAPFLVALQALPLGGWRVGGRMLLVHADDEEATLAWAARAVAHNRRIIAAGVPDGEKYPGLKYARTRIVETLTEIETERGDRPDAGAAGFTVLWLTNSGQGPDIEAFEVPAQIVGFLRRALSATLRPVWNRIAEVAWVQDRDGQRRNDLYENALRLPGDLQRFVRRHLLGHRATTEGPLGSWILAAAFCEEVIRMDDRRVDAIRALADRLADQIVDDNDRRLLRELVGNRRYYDLRNTLIKSGVARVKRGRPPTVGFDEYLLVFEGEDGVERVDWQLARDLLLIRLLERLHERQEGRAALEALPEAAEDEDEAPVVTGAEGS